MENARYHGRGTTLIFESGMERLLKEFTRRLERNANLMADAASWMREVASGKKLWTRRGLAHFAFIIETPEAWAIYKEMERVYLMTMGIK